MVREPVFFACNTCNRDANALFVASHTHFRIHHTTRQKQIPNDYAEMEIVIVMLKEVKISCFSSILMRRMATTIVI
jgi:hypothetical protein